MTWREPRRQASVLLLAVAFSVASGCGSPPEFTVSPKLAPNPNPDVPLAAILSAETGQPTVLSVRVREGNSEWDVPTPAEFATRHDLPLLGFRPGRTHTLEVTAIDAQGRASALVPLSFAAPTLPMEFPRIETIVSEPDRMEPGVTLFSLMRWPDGEDSDEEFGLTVAVDESGQVVWYRASTPAWEDPHRISSGNLLGIVGYNRVEEVDMLGNVVSLWHAAEHPDSDVASEVPEGSIPVTAETFHHDIQELPNGNLLVLSTEMRFINDYPIEVGPENPERAPANVIGDVVIEFSRDGTVINEWRLMDMLDVYRLGYESLGGVWDDWAYGDVEGGTKDWSHGNSVWYDADSGSILVSLRHQEAVISFSRATGELNWILGTHEGWDEPFSAYLLTPEGELQWPYHQHAAETTDSGSLLVYDNGNFRAMPPAPSMAAAESYSRAVEYLVDSKRNSIRQLWDFGPEQEVFYSPFISEADPLPVTGNVLVTDGGRIRDEEGRQSGEIVGGEHWARILEVTRAAEPEKVFEITIDAQSHAEEIGWAVYRSERLPSLYPD